MRHGVRHASVARDEARPHACGRPGRSALPEEVEGRVRSATSSAESSVPDATSIKSLTARLLGANGRPCLEPLDKGPRAGIPSIMGFHEKHRVATWLGEAGSDFSRGKWRLLFKCELDLGPGHAEETLFTVGPDDSGEWMLLCRETEWSDEGYAAVAGVPMGAFPEPEVWGRLLEAYLRALKKSEGYEGHEFTSVKTAPRGPLPKAEIRAILDKVFG